MDTSTTGRAFATSDTASANAHGRIPATVVTGFLGAGKTSLIRHLLENANGKRLALIVNEFGDIGVDGDVLKACGNEDCSEDDIVELTNGCICCTVADDFLPTMEALLARHPRPDHIVIETSGLALPKPLVTAFNWPEVRTQSTVDGVIAVVDVPAVAAGLFATNPDAVDAQRASDPSLDHESPLEELFEDQLACADMVVLNKTDLVDDSTLADVEATVRKQLRSTVKMVHARHGQMDPAALLGLEAAVEDDLAARPSHHDNDADHDHDEFESFAVITGAISDPSLLSQRIKSVMTNHGVLRVKGFLPVDGKDMRLAVQAVGGRVQHYFDREWSADESRSGHLVVIGLAGLDQETITAALQG